ncbi:SAF domain-containing protein [Streptomyces sp. GQFP]|uniref:SAF domain-containing protein n=1 Tax=Streptomyces sp. GQFP TaxID=2907545 RepID=UPI001F1C510B|nr:SAF domain-containing protein [Streptomyces sp. GQFP]UIX34295.1 SAF domain-containing protein [Streptomyces sp. GQFP]
MGVLLVLGCTAGGVVVAMRAGHQEPVLVLARAVAVGQALSEQDLREESLSADSGVAFVPARSRARVEGRPVAYSLPAGTPLTENVLGEARVPPAGRAVAAVGLKAGQFPPGVQPGNRVAVVVAPSGDSTAGSASPPTSVWGASVTDVRGDSADQTTVISLQMAQEDARRLAAAPAGQISVVVVPGGAP